MQNIVHKSLKVTGMTCANCERRIEDRLNKLKGVVGVKAELAAANVAVAYDANVVGLNAIISAITALDYQVNAGNGDRMPLNHKVAIGIIIAALYVILSNTAGGSFIPKIDQNMGYGVLFVVGLITSFHCLAMCGGLNLSQCLSYQSAGANKLSLLRPSLLYNLGRVVSYTVMGGIVGTLGSAISFSRASKGAVAVVSGIFMVIMGLNMLNIFPWLRRFNPRLPRFLTSRISSGNSRRGPLYVGLLNGLMPCGPLQAMELYALGTGSFAAGALSMFMFSLGTVPLMFGFGAVSSFLSGRFTRRMMKAGAVLVTVLGLVMLSRGLSLSGVNMAYAASPGSVSVAKLEGNVQVVTTTLESGRYAPLIVQEGVPVRWNIKADEDDLNGCNDALIIPKFNLEKSLVPGNNYIEFTPDAVGNIPYSCWMGMIRSSIKVVPDLKNVSSEDITAAGSLTGSGTAGGCACCATGR